MRLAVFSDIHSNHIALEACFREADKRGADMWVFLGDYISDCAYPHKTMELLYQAMKEHDCRFVKGNREEYILDHHKNGSNWTYGTTTGSLLYTYENMMAEDIEFIDQLPYNDVIRIEGADPIHICHGAPYKTRVLLEPDNGMAQKVLRDIDEPVMMSGHSHKPFIEDCSGKLYVNPGSLGIPTSGVTQAEMAFMEWDGNRWVPELVRVPYDIEAVVQEMCVAGLMECTSVWAPCIVKGLRTARNYAMDCLNLAAKLADGEAVTNKHLMRAAEELGVFE